MNRKARKIRAASLLLALALATSVASSEGGVSMSGAADKSVVVADGRNPYGIQWPSGFDKNSPTFVVTYEAPDPSTFPAEPTFRVSIKVNGQTVPVQAKWNHETHKWETRITMAPPTPSGWTISVQVIPDNQNGGAPPVPARSYTL